MSRFVLDCSIVISWYFEDETSDYAEEVLDYLDQARAIVPVIWALEIANVLAIEDRVKKRKTRSSPREFLSLLERLPVSLDEETSRRTFQHVFALAQTHRLTAYDAAYLDLAQLRKLPLATLDLDLLKAMKTAGVELLKP